MATSGSIALTATGQEIITEALEQLGVLSEGETPSADTLTSCNRTFNYLIKAWQMEGLNLFALQKTFLFLHKDVNEYRLDGQPTGANWTTSFSKTRLTVGAVATDLTITVDDASEISDGDFIGIFLDSGNTHWTTVNGAPAGNVVTITAEMPSGAAQGKYVYSYTTKAGFPLRLDRVVKRDTNDNDIPVSIIPLEEYSRITPKTTDGQPLQVYFEPQRTYADLFIWPEPDDPTDYLVCWVARKLEDITDVATDEVDFPQEWFLPLSLNLATLLIPKYGTPAAHGSLISKLAKYWKDIAEGWDSEDGFQIQPANQNNQD